MGTIDIYTDGSCLSNPGKGGWAVVFPNGENRSLVGNSVYTTNNRMEIYAVYQAIKLGIAVARAGDTLHIHSDSSYVVNAISKGWLARWCINGWKNSSDGSVANVDLWRKILFLLGKAHDKGIGVDMVKVKGHDGDEFNEKADALAKEAASNA